MLGRDRCTPTVSIHDQSEQKWASEDNGCLERAQTSSCYCPQFIFFTLMKSFSQTKIVAQTMP
jgi:hypothetical protein